MAKIKEMYLWIIFAVLVVAAALYFRFYYQPQLSISVDMPAQAASIYPYEQGMIPIVISNTGSATFNNMTFGLYVNGNTTKIYKASIPAGKQATVYYNYTPTVSGTYVISMVADPSNLYNIANRQSARGSTQVTVLQTQAADPASSFNSTGLLGENVYNMTPGGFEVGTYLLNNFTARQFELTNSSQANGFIYPALDVFAPYINQIAVAHAFYNGTYLASVWIQGYLSVQAMREAALGKGLNYTEAGNTTVISFGNYTTLCSWYSGGWIKNLVVVGANQVCTNYVGVNNANAKVPSAVYQQLKEKNYSILNYSGYYGNQSFAGDISIYNDSFVYESLMKGGNYSNICYGSILNVSGNNYCNTYQLGSGNFILIQNQRLFGDYNLSVWTLSNSVSIGENTQSNLALANAYNITGSKIYFVSAYVNKCSLLGFLCTNTTFAYNSLNLSLTNEFNYSVSLSGIKCYSAGSANVTQLDTTIPSGGTALVSTPCYANGNVLSGVPLGLGLYLVLNYSTPHGTVTTDGAAYILK